MTESATMRSAAAAAPAPADSPRSWLLPPLIVYAASRLVVLAAGQISLWVNRGLSWDKYLSDQWDAGWFMKVVREGYPHVIPPGGIPASQTTLAFFPGYPAAVRLLRWITHLPDVWVAVAVALAGGAVAAVLLWRLTDLLYDRSTATRVVALFCFAPSAFVFSLTYSEGMFLGAAVGCIYALFRRQWLLAGLAGAVASATRPPGAALAVACAIAALVELRRNRTWQALLAPALAPLGALAYLFYLERHTGSPRSYSITLDQGWGQKVDLGRATLDRFLDIAGAPWRHPYFALNYLTIALVAVVIGLLLLRRAPVVLPVTAFLFFAPGIAGTALLSTPRYALAAFPVFVGLGRELRGVWFWLAWLLSASLMVGLTIGSASHVYIP